MIDSNGITKSSILKMISKTNFGIYGGQFVPEALMPAIGELTARHGCCVDEFVVKRFEA
jgi:tryptophan synthase beta subunit